MALSPRTLAPSITVLPPVLLVFALAGCSSSAEGPDPDSSEEVSPTEGASSDFVRPEDPYAGADTTLSERPHLPVHDHRLDLYERYVVDRAVDTLVVECLVDLGHEASVAPETRMDPLAMSAFGPQREYRRYGNVRVDIAEEHGFGPPEDEGGIPTCGGTRTCAPWPRRP